MKKTLAGENGYMAIVTAIILSLVMLAIASVSGSSSLWARMNETDAYSKRISYFLSRSCLDYSLLRLAQTASYAGSATVPVGSDQCTLRPVVPSGVNTIIEAKGQFNGATTNLRLTVVTQDLSTVSLEEITSF